MSIRCQNRVVLCLALFSGVIGARAAEQPLFRDPTVPIERRVDDLLRQLTLEEKVGLCCGEMGKSSADRFFSGGVPRLGIERLSFRDGPVGVRTFDGTTTTALPSTIGLASSWDPGAAADYGRVLAEEMKALDRQVLFGPGVNLMRDPRGGRNFEYFGEDPYLTGVFGVAYIRAVQAAGVAADAKHLVANDYETLRHFTSANLDERTLREIHFLPFEMAIHDGEVWSIMTANSLVNGVHVTENPAVLHDLVRERMGFDGVVLTDWRAAYNTVPAAMAGTDMTTGLCAYVFADGNLLAAVKAGKVPEAMIDEKARRILRLYARTGLLDPAGTPRNGALDTPEHRQAARRLAGESIVLLKNDGDALPLDKARLKTVFVTGPGADYVAFGHGSGQVHAAHLTTPMEGLRAAWGDEVALQQVPWEAPAGGRETKGQGAVPMVLSEADLAMAGKADAVLFFAADTPHGEGGDLASIELPGGQVEEIEALATVNRHVIVVVQSGQPVMLDGFADKVPAIVEAWYLGEAAGDAIADVLTGAVNPSGRLCATFAKKMEDYPCEALGLWPPRKIIDLDKWDAGHRPQDRKATYGVAADYKEGVFIGYRWFDQKGIDPLYAFGHGLSYTTFEFGGLSVDASGPAWRVSCTVTNSGKRAGAEVVQVYVAPPSGSAVARPPRELKGFAKVSLKPGESRRVEIALRPSAPCYFDATQHDWRADAGRYEVEVGASSRDIRLRAAVELREPVVRADY